MRVFTVVEVRGLKHASGAFVTSRDDSESGSSQSDGTEAHLPTWVWDLVPTRHLIERLSERAGCQVVVDEEEATAESDAGEATVSPGPNALRVAGEWFAKWDTA